MRLTASATIAPLVAPLITEPTRERRREERRIALQADHWFAHQSVPSHAVLRCARWHESHPVLVEDTARFSRLMAPLEESAFGGIRRHSSEGPWS